MSTSSLQSFLKTAKHRTQLTSIQSRLNNSIGKYHSAVIKGKEQFIDLEKSRQEAYMLKRYAMDHLPNLLEEFERNITNNGAKVLWAKDGTDALNYVLDICQSVNCKSVVKSKSMATEELHLNDFLLQHHINPIETDLGEFIQQLDGEPPVHILTPAMHKSKEDVAALFEKKLGVPPNLSPYELTKIARQQLRDKYRKAEVGITGANFIIPDIGGIALTENEGNARMTVGFPKTHIVIVGIEKMIPNIESLHLFWPLLATHGTGQNITVYNTIVRGPENKNKQYGPENMYVILLDNGRSNLYANKELRESLYCIRCGACLNICPIYKSLSGGFGYETTYSGPIGSVITPHLKSLKQYSHLSDASSLCGACTTVCPVKIPLHHLLLKNRKQKVLQKHLSFKERIGWKIWAWGATQPQWINYIPHKIKNFMLKKLFYSSPNIYHPPKASDESFSQWWKKNHTPKK